MDYPMNQRDKDALDRHITGNYGEDQFKDFADDPNNYDDFDEKEHYDAFETRKRMYYTAVVEALDIYYKTNFISMSIISEIHFCASMHKTLDFMFDFYPDQTQTYWKNSF